MDSLEIERKFKIGDIVRIRDWDDMAAEFGESSYGDIHISERAYFVPGMLSYCGTTLEVVNIGEHYGLPIVIFEDNSEWIFTEDMCTLVSSTTDIDFDISEFESLLASEG